MEEVVYLMTRTSQVHCNTKMKKWALDNAAYRNKAIYFTNFHILCLSSE